MVDSNKHGRGSEEIAHTCISHLLSQILTDLYVSMNHSCEIFSSKQLALFV